MKISGRVGYSVRGGEGVRIGVGDEVGRVQEVQGQMKEVRWVDWKMQD